MYNFCTMHGVLDTYAGEQACNCTEMMPLWQQEQTWGGSQELLGDTSLSSKGAVLQKQLQGQAAHPSAAPTLWGQQSIWSFKVSCHLAANPNWIPGLQLEIILPILKGFLWLKEIYNQGDNPRDSTNSWRQNYWVRARKRLLELLQILIFFLNNFAKQ